MNLIIIERDTKSPVKKEKLEHSKGMIRIKGEYLIERIIRIGRNNGITRVFCINNSNDTELEHYLAINNFQIPTNLIVPYPEGYMHILFALASAHNKEPLFLVNTNSVFLEREFSEFVTYSVLQEDADATVAVTRLINDEKPLGVAMNDEDIIIKFNDSDGYTWFNGGIYYFAPGILKKINTFQPDKSGIDQFLKLLIADGFILKGFSFSKIINAENAADIAKAEEMIRGNE